jgi:FSR family fosmidomycin resistance protein-like MFS transporter
MALLRPASFEGKASERAILWYTCAAHALTHVYMMLFTAVLGPMGESFDLGREEVTAYATISTVLFGLGALPAGWLGDRFGEQRLLVAFFLLTALGGIVLGVAQGTAALAAGMAFVGLGASIFHPVGNALISKGIALPGKALGINGLWGSLGTAAGPAIAAQAAAAGSWRWAYLGLALPMAVLGLMLARSRFESAAPPAARALDGGAAAPPQEAAPAPPARGRRAGMVALLLLAMTCGGFYFQLIVTILPTHLGESSPGSLASPVLLGGYLAALVYAVGGAGQLLSGNLIHRREGRGLYVLVLGGAALSIYAVSALGGASLLLASGIMAILVFAAQPIENALLARYSPSSLRGLLFGLKFVLAFGVGGLGTRSSGVISAAHGNAAVFVVAAGVTALALLLAALAWSFRRA